MKRKMKLTPELHYVLYFGLYILLPLNRSLKIELHSSITGL